MAEHNPQIWTHYKIGLQEKVLELDEDQYFRERFDQAISGQTNIKCFDHWVSELNETGYLHNHARMWLASIWIFTLKLPWELGADFFLRNLLDGDPASNTLSWRWVAGLHTKGKSYLARSENIQRFTNGRFNPEGQLASIAEPLTEADENFPAPILPQTDALPKKPFLLLIHEDDCLSESLLHSHQKPADVIGTTATSLRSPLPIDKKVRAFAKGAVTNGLDRLGGESSILEDNWAEGLIKACVSADVKITLGG